MDTETSDSSDSPTVFPPFIVASLARVGSSVLAAILCGNSCVTVFVYEHNLTTKLPCPTAEDTQLSRYLYFVNNFDDLGVAEELEEWIATPLLPLLHDLHQASTHHRARLLHEHLHPEFLALAIKVVEGELVAQPCDHDTSFERIVFERVEVPNLHLGGSSSNITQFEALELVIESGRDGDQRRTEQLFPEWPRAVRLLHGPETKMAYKGVELAEVYEREVTTLLRLQSHPSRDAVQIPRLEGLVRDLDAYVGFLTTFIDHQYTLGDIFRHAQIDITSQVRRRWVSQIESAVSALHDLGLCWGDVKPSNVLIDLDMNAWVIDFGGGYTEGWVPPKLQGTRAGDMEGLARLKVFVASGGQSCSIEHTEGDD